MDDFNDIFEELNSLRKKQKDIIKSSTKQMSDYVMNIDFASLYPNVQKRYSITSDLRKKILKINKILKNINDYKGVNF
jgi:DNA polymerase elongation subunit (family B)